MNARDEFLGLLQDNKKGKGTGMYSVCSSQPHVIRASMQQALADNSHILIESTSNQVDQNGGYTGMKPADFVAYVYSLAAQENFPKERVLLGGDHLGPNVWQNLPAEEAMKNSHVLIREYVKAGYQKIHLDASMFLADDQGDRHQPLADEVVSERAAALCQTAEAAWKEFCPKSLPPVYIIGTEVPIPGGAQEAEESLKVTSAADVEKTIAVTKSAFEAKGLSEAWGRVVGVVTQPGVEFGDDQVFDYRPADATSLSAKIADYDGMVFEAHSTDYQTEEGLTNLVRDHFCILKVGPWLTYAFREALYGLAAIEQELLKAKPDTQSQLRAKIEEVMLSNPKYWQKYYPGDAQQQYMKRCYSFSDRVRYYWPDDRLVAAVNTLFANLRSSSIPLSLLSQYFPAEYTSVREGQIKNDPEAIVFSKIRGVVGMYARACGFRS